MRIIVKGLDKAIRDTTARKRWIDRKTKEFVTRLQEVGINAARMYYSRAAYAGDLRDGDARVDTSVKVEKTATGYRAMVRATGRAVLFIEFGTGIYHENDYQIEHGYFAGSYNPRSFKALQPWGWFYSGHPGSHAPEGTEEAHNRSGSVHTYGNPANRVMYNTKEQIETLMSGIAREVFRD